MITLPSVWIENTEWDSARAGERLGVCSWRTKTITYFPRSWFALLWPFIKPLVMMHERGHANGVPETGCLGGHKWCMMAEEEGGVDSWKGKIKLWPAQVLHGLRFCDQCQAVIDSSQ